MFVNVLPECTSVYQEWTFSEAPKRECHIFWKWRYRWFLAIMWVLGTDYKSSAKASVLDCNDISLAREEILCVVVVVTNDLVEVFQSD